MANNRDGALSPKNKDKIEMLKASEPVEKKFDVNANLGKFYRVYKSRGSKDENFVVDFIGCQDNGIAHQIKVQQLRRDITKKTGISADFVMNGGDATVEHGLSSATDPVTKTNHHDIYTDDEVFFHALGNHEHGFPVTKGMRVTGIDNDLKKAGYFVEHGYLKEGKLDEERVKLFAGEELYLDEMKAKGITWVCPARFYHFSYGKTHTFVNDASTYEEEYLYHVTNFKDPRFLKNQALWLEEAYKASTAERKELLTHNSLDTDGKRLVVSETEEYLKSEQAAQLQSHLASTSSFYHVFLKRTLQKQGFHFDEVDASHDHAVYHKVESSEEKNSVYDVQVVSGGAGCDKMQSRYVFPAETKMFSKRHGFVRKQGDQVDYYNLEDEELKKEYGIEGHHVRFKGKLGPLKESSDEAGVKELKELFFAAADEFVKKFPPREQQWVSQGPVPCLVDTGYKIPFTDIQVPRLSYVNRARDHVAKDYFFVDDVANHFHRFEANTFKSCVDYLKFAFERSPELLKMFNQFLQEQYGADFDKFTKMSLEEQRKLMLEGKKKEAEKKLEKQQQPEKPVEADKKETPQLPTVSSTPSMLTRLLNSAFSRTPSPPSDSEKKSPVQSPKGNGAVAAGKQLTDSKGAGLTDSTNAFVLVSPQLRPASKPMPIPGAELKSPKTPKSPAKNNMMFNTVVLDAAALTKALALEGSSPTVMAKA
jgi:hypothetical protein